MEDSMKKALLISGIVPIVIGVIAFIIGGMFRYACCHTSDGSDGLYSRQRKIMKRAFLIGTVLLIIGTVFLILSKKVG